LLICLEDNCAKVCRFVLYLLNMRQIDGNANFRNELCNFAIHLSSAVEGGVVSEALSLELC